MVIWNPKSIFSGYTPESIISTHNGGRVVSSDEVSILKEDIRRRHEEIKKFLEIGKTLVIILPPPEVCYYKFSHGSSFTYLPITMAEVLPFKEIEPVLAEWESVAFKGPEIFKPFYDSVGEYLGYHAYLKNPIGKPFLYIKDTTEVVGTFLEYGIGKVLLIPGLSIRDSSSPSHHNKYVEAVTKYLEGIVKLAIDLNKAKEEYSLPDWANRYLLPSEKDKRIALTKEAEELEKIKNKMSDINQSINNIEKNKVLICGSGEVLEDQVTKILEEISFKMIDRPVGRDDIIVEYNGMPAVIEVKGVSKSAAEKHAAQLEKWVSNYYESNGKPCKGILIVNPFCDIPLEERKDEAFPKQMLPYSSSRGHCLITTVQLLGLYIKIKSDPINRDRYIKELYETDGVFEKYDDYKLFLET